MKIVMSFLWDLVKVTLSSHMHFLKAELPKLSVFEIILVDLLCSGPTEKYKSFWN